jgi:excisionase family DNA binding protein
MGSSPNATAQQWLTADEAASFLRISRRALYQRVRCGQVKAHRFGRNLRFNYSELETAIVGADNPLSIQLGSLSRRLATGKGG